MFVHANLDPIKAYLREDVLYDMDLAKVNSYVKCIIYGISSYPGSVPTFQIMVGGESLFAYIPPHLLSIKEPQQGKVWEHFYWNLSDIVYHNCPEAEFSVSKMDLLTTKSVLVFINSAKVWKQGVYLFTMDWYRGNDLLHCIALDDGQIGFFPNHKLSYGEKKFLPYLKMHREWKV